ncbi:MAG: response regulator [Betaproteobacteria bacterium]
MNAAERPASLYILEDDPLVARTVGQALEGHGFECRWFKTAGKFFDALRSGPLPTVCVVDLGLPDRDGLDVVKELGAKHDCGVLVLTARGLLSDRVLGLELGADDYMVKPFEPRELIARLRSILRRRGHGGSAFPQDARRVARFDGWSFDPAALSLAAPDGEEEVLSAAEARLLLAFLERPSCVLSREQLAGNLDLLPMDRSIDVRVSRLRRRLRDDPQDPRLIKTVYGAGYLFAAAVRWDKSNTSQ